MIYASLESIFTYPTCVFMEHKNCDDFIRAYIDKNPQMMV